ncbi:hypothetical protein Goarm_002837, partial [Gossypium armourianum]|nr:hypothetical protein [Gossypium armourianum]
MASAAIFSSVRRRRSPSLEAFLVPVDLTQVALVQTLAALSSDLVSCFSDHVFFFQRRNSRSLVRKVEIFLVVLAYLRDSRSGSSSNLSPTAVLCFKELYLLLYRSKILLDYCSQSSKLWLLLQSHSIAGHFHDLNQEISTLLDVFPIKDLNLSDDIKEQVELLQKQGRQCKLYVDKNDEVLRLKFFSFLDEFENGRIPNHVELRLFFVERLGIKDVESCRSEIEFLEEQIVNHEGDIEPAASVLNGFIAITRYCQFLLFGFEEDELRLCFKNPKKPWKGLISQEMAHTFLTIPKDFCCPISLDLMKDPVTVSTGQTYDRKSFAAALPIKAAIEANRATAVLLIQQLANGSQGAQTVAAREIRLLAKTGKENRAFIAEAGAIPHLRKLLSSSNPVAQENAVTAMLNLSIYAKNKSRIMDEDGCLGSIVEVLRLGLTVEARQNAAATLFSLSAVHEYKKRIADQGGAVEALAELLRVGTPRGKKDAVTALFNLATHADNCSRMIEAGA